MTAKDFFLEMHRVPLKAWLDGFFGALVFMTAIVLFQTDGSTAKGCVLIHENIVAAWTFLLTGTLFGCWVWLDHEQEQQHTQGDHHA